MAKEICVDTVYEGVCRVLLEYMYKYDEDENFEPTDEMEVYPTAAEFEAEYGHKPYEGLCLREVDEAWVCITQERADKAKELYAKIDWRG